ncbi:uncharacterized protein LOC136078814 [Hydra vulgaris]|uniref:Uncharacterized protein LOC136078814 n=1 Tax=Hydra vulgaris TaxID=6087 RepID=A0ABM4BNK9_HYDVU
MDKTNFVRRKEGEKFNEDCLVQRVKQPLKIMVWSVISGQGTGKVYIVQNTMHQDQYVKVLEERLIPQAKEWFQDGKFIFQNDSPPCHKAKSVFRQQRNYCFTLARKFTRPKSNRKFMRTFKAGNKQNLIERLIEVWHRNENIQKQCLNLIKSMPRRVAAVIAAKGGHTKY